MVINKVMVIISLRGMRGLVHALHFAEKANLKVVPYGSCYSHVLRKRMGPMWPKSAGAIRP